MFLYRFNTMICLYGMFFRLLIFSFPKFKRIMQQE